MVASTVSGNTRYSTSIFLASPTPVTISYNIISSKKTKFAGCPGDTLNVNYASGSGLVYVWCDPEDDMDGSQLLSVASGITPFSFTVPFVDTSGVATTQCFLTNNGQGWNNIGVQILAVLEVWPRPPPVSSGSPTLSCPNCSSGYKSNPGDQTCTACGLGYYSSPVSQTCTACPAGTKCDTTTTPSPVNCGKGNYQGQPGQSVCLPCPLGYYCDSDTTITPTACPAGTYRIVTGAAGVLECTTCPTGNYCPINSTTPTNCSAGTYQNILGATISTQCLACPAGQYCGQATTTPTSCAAGSFRATPGASTQSDCADCTAGDYCLSNTVTPTPCPAGSYRGTTGAQSVNDCSACIVGNYCPSPSVNPVNCSAGTHRDTISAGLFSDCLTCTTGTYSLDLARSSMCPPCAANSYCTNPTTIKSCPTHTSSAPGSYSLLNCRCDQGFRCAYSKKISAVVTLNSTVSNFNSNFGGVKDAFINAVASAAGVSASQVSIGNVAPKTGGRRLLGEGSLIDVHTSIEGAERLHKLDMHLKKHSAFLHVDHVWEERHSVISTAVARRPILST